MKLDLMNSRPCRRFALSPRDPVSSCSVVDDLQLKPQGSGIRAATEEHFRGSRTPAALARTECVGTTDRPYLRLCRQLVLVIWPFTVGKDFA